jgi:hypothetical protein
MVFLRLYFIEQRLKVLRTCVGHVLALDKTTDSLAKLSATKVQHCKK